MNPEQAINVLLNYLEKEPAMGPIVALLLQFLPQILESILKKEAFATKNGFVGPLSTFLNDKAAMAALTAATASYDRCVKAMAEAPK